MNKYSLNNKWYIPREEKFEEEGFSTFEVLSQVLIHITDQFQQLPGGKIDLKDTALKVGYHAQLLEDVAIFFDERCVDGENIMFFDVKDFKDVPNGA